MSAGTVYATVSDLQGRWPSLPATSEAQATVLLGAASRKLRAAVPGLDDLITAGTIEAELVTDVCCSMVKRAMVAGDAVDGVQQQSAGPYSMTFANPTGDLYLTKSEKADLGISRQRAFTIDLLPEAT